MIIVDTNILIYLYVQCEYTSSVESLIQVDSTWAAPLLWRSEFRNVLALYLRKNIISLQQALEIINEAESLMIDNEYQTSSEAVLSLVNASNCSAYDCEFVSLAKQFDVPLITQDKKILTEFPHYSSELVHFIKSNFR
jgi:predicted nucleic acid-binding protein